MTERSGRPVMPLLQATDIVIPGYPGPAVGWPREAVFVGSTNEHRDRRLVLQAVEAGIPLAVHGRGWEELPPGVWRSEYVPNHELSALYRRHRVVLADHWPDMARHGFIANRVFDAVASGAWVISDDVLDIEEALEARVLVCRSPEEIRDSFARLLTDPPDADELDCIAGQFAAGHSFRARAKRLVDAVSEASSHR